MEDEVVIGKDMKVEIPGPEPETTSPTTAMISSGGLTRQGSVSNKHNCLCSPTTHAGSFRCRLHRGGGGPSLQRTRSMDSQACQGPQSKPDPVGSVPKPNNAVDAN